MKYSPVEASRAASRIEPGVEGDLGLAWRNLILGSVGRGSSSVSLMMISSQSV